jgi:hypothetical protein
MSDDDVSSYVDAASAAQGLVLTSEQRAGVIANFARIAQIAAPLVDFPLGHEDEQAPVYRP